ncbi:MAG TPA: tol-pal system protein YbgF [Hyphomicrobium sp.]
MLTQRFFVSIFAGASLAAGAALAEPAHAPLLLAQQEETQPAQQPKAKSAAPQAAQDSGLKQRIEQLEEQLVDMQVVVGTLESLARGGGGPAAAAGGGASYGGGGVDSVRLDGLETQMRALSAQIQQLTDQVRALGGQPRRSDAVGAPAGAMPGATPTDSAAAPPPSAGDAPDSGRFGSTTVTAGSGGDAIGGLIETDPSAAGGATHAPGPASGAPGAETAGGADMAALPPAFGAATAPNAADAGNAKQLYETAYGYLMQRDYGAAQGAFEDFLTRYPQDSLAGNAQYWLGEAHFVRGEYKAAASSFLKGYQNYAGNARAADSLLKLAMSLDRLGQKDAACSSFGELSTRFPNAPENVKMRAKSERQRIGCT